MAGIVSLLDEEYAQRLIDVRQRLEDELGVTTPITNHYPHFSYQVGERYDDTDVEQAIRRIADNQEPFTIRTNGIGIFTDSDPFIVSIPVIRDAHLSEVQSIVWEAGKQCGTEFQDYYRSESWTPHITIVPVARENIGPVVELLSEYAFYWAKKIDNLAMIKGDTPNRKVKYRTSLSSDSPSP